MGGNGVFRIMVGVDGSAPSRRALEWAVEETRLRGGEVHAVTTWAFPAVTVGMEGLIHDPDLFPQAARRLQDEALKRVDSKGVPISGEVDQGSAAAVLLRAAEGADLLVVGSRGLGGFTGLLLGSVSTQLVHHSPAPVLVVRSRPDAGE
jgi:nucleotide-binding universal stress UspA family protein